MNIHTCVKCVCIYKDRYAHIGTICILYAYIQVNNLYSQYIDVWICMSIYKHV